MRINIEASSEELAEIGAAQLKHLPEAIIDALDLHLSLPGYTVTVNEPSAIQAQLVEALMEYKRLYEEVQPTGGWQGVYEIGNDAIDAAGAQP